MCNQCLDKHMDGLPTDTRLDEKKAGKDKKV